MTTQEPSIFDVYKVKLTLVRPMLATNPLDPYIHSTHIINKQRELITENKGINKEINKYLSQIQISPEKADAEIQKIVDRLEEIMGYELTEEQRELAVAGKLNELKQTFKELDIRGVTVFFWDKETDKPCVGDHMIYGYMKAASDAIRMTRPKKNGTILQSGAFTTTIINTHVRCHEMFIPFDQDIIRDENGKPQYLQRSLRAETAQGPRVTLAKSEQVGAGASLTFHLKVLKNSPMVEEHIRTIFSYAEDFSGLGQWRNAGWGMFSTELERVTDSLAIPKRKAIVADRQATVTVQ